MAVDTEGGGEPWGMKLRRKRWSWLVIETKSLKSSLPERRRRRRFIFALCDSSFLLDVNLFTFWTEETLIEDKSLSFCTCNGERWRRLFSFYKLLMILKETSDMENLLQMVHLSGLFMVWESIQTFPSRNRHVLVR